MGLLDSLKRMFGASAVESANSGSRPVSGEELSAPARETGARHDQVAAGPILPGFLAIGQTDAVCPNCNVPLPKMPGRKTKCPTCSQFMFVRTRPRDRKRVLVTAADLPILEAQWAQYSLLPSASRESGLTPDQEWARCNRELIEHARNGDWGLYRNTRADMAALLYRQGRLRDALTTYLEVSYLDLNGPNNLGGCRDREIVREFPPFSARNGFLAPGIVELTSGLASAAALQPAEVEALFLESATRLQASLRLPVKPQTAWKRLRPR